MAADQSRRDEVLGVIAQEAAIDPATIDLSATMTDLGINSLELVELIFKVESHFAIEIPNEGPLDGTDVTVAALVDHVLALVDAARRDGTGAAAAS